MVRTLQDIINSEIVVSELTVTGASFSEVMIIEETAATITDRVTEYGTLQDLLDDGYTTSDQVYKMATAYFSQEAPKPSAIYVGKKTKTQYNVWTVNFNDNLTTGSFTLTMDTKTTAAIPYNASNGDIRAAIDAAFSATATCFVTGFNNTDLTAIATISFCDRDVVALTANVAGLTGGGGAITATLTDTIAYSLGESWATALTACRQDDDTAYEYQIANEDFFAIASMAAAVETLEKQFGALTKDTDVLNENKTTDIASFLKALAYKRTVLHYSSKSDAYPQSAISGYCLPRDPGSINWNGRPVAGVTAESKLTAGQNTAAVSKNVSYAYYLGGKTIITNGEKSSSGRFRDITFNADYLNAKIEENLFALYTGVDKIGYDDNGINLLAGSLQEILINEGVDKNILVDGTLKISFVKRADVPAATRATRVYSGLSWSAGLAGAIDRVEIYGTVVI